MRIRVNFIEGELIGSVTDESTTLFATIFSDLPEIEGASDDYLVLIVGDEVVYVTEHQAMSNSVTVTRGEEGTMAKDWGVETPVIHGPTTYDFPVPLTQAEYDALTPPIPGVFYVIVEDEE